ncbi:MAG: type VI secretion system-associated FHA domain protein TagH [Janthinobacterium lividum]
MTLTLSIRNVARLDNGMPTELVLHRRGALIGRSSTSDWSLPDPRNHISSRHLEVRFDGRFYMASDVSTNGTFLNGAGERMAGARRVEEGDVFQIGHYEVQARLSGDAADALAREDDAAAGAADAAQWRGWDGGATPRDAATADDGWAHSGRTGAEPAPSAGWDSAPAQSSAPSPAASGWSAPPATGGAAWQPQVGPSLARVEAHREAARPVMAAPPIAGGGWSPSMRAPDPPVSSAWASAAPAPDPASGWSSAAPDRPAAPSADDIWGRIAEGNVVDWARGGFGQPVEQPRDLLGLAPPPAQAALPTRPMPIADWSAPGRVAAPPGPPSTVAERPPAPAPMSPTPPTAADGSAAAVERFAAAAGMAPGSLADASPAMLDCAGALFRRLVAGLVVMVEARARAKAQLGAEATAFSPGGHNPLKFVRAPDEAVAMLLGAPQRGFMPAEQAIEDAFLDLQSHQVATLKAMQGALRTTLDRFSPAAIRGRAEARGLLARILPAARDAALWQAYEREFGGVAQGSDEAFLDVFAKEFRRAYNEQSHGPAPSRGER